MRKIHLCGWLLVCNILFIWGNSLLPGSVSGAISSWLRNLPANILSGDFENASRGDGFLRKVAHIIEFACLGALLTWLISLVRKRWYLTLLIGLAVACGDELIQCFVPNRGPAVLDVCIDMAGVLLGIAILSLGKAIINHIQRKQ